MSETRNIFARNLSRLVEESGIEQQKLAFDLNVSPSIVSSWVLGKAMVYSDSNLWVAKDTKTTTSTRTLNIPPFLLAHLNALPREGDSIL